MKPRLESAAFTAEDCLALVCSKRPTMPWILIAHARALESDHRDADLMLMARLIRIGESPGNHGFHGYSLAWQGRFNGRFALNCIRCGGDL